MKILMSVPMEGPNTSRRPGATLDTADASHNLPEAEAFRLIERGLATLVDMGDTKPPAAAKTRTAPTEKAVKPGAEKAVK